MSELPENEPIGDGCDERLLRRIVRQIDGELGEAERAELTRRLVRDPSAHRLADEIASADRSAAEALQEAFAGGGQDALRQWSAARRRLASRRLRARAGMAAAAAVLLGFGVWAVDRALRPPVAGGGRKLVVNGNDRRTEPPEAAGALPVGVERLIWHAWDTGGQSMPTMRLPGRLIETGGGLDSTVPLPRIEGPRRSRRAVDRHIYTVQDESDGTIYLLGVDRIRTRIRAVGEEL